MHVGTPCNHDLNDIKMCIRSMCHSTGSYIFIQVPEYVPLYHLYPHILYDEGIGATILFPIYKDCPSVFKHYFFMTKCVV